MPALPKLDQVLITLHPNGILELRLNTPKNLNAFGPEKCEQCTVKIGDALLEC